MVLRFWSLAVAMILASAFIALPVPAAADDEPVCFECHDYFPEFAFQHEPAGSGECEACHEDHGDEETLMLVEEGSALCYQCHDEMGEGKSVHPPVEDGECTACHNPHGSENETLLVTPSEELCFECHDNYEEGSHQVLHAALDDGCMECHNPHSSPYDKLFTASLTLSRLEIFTEEQGELCFNCHDLESFTSKRTEDTEFRQGQNNLHALHLTGGAKPNKYGILKKRDGQTCVACHLPHTALQERLIRTEFECKGTFCYTMRFVSNDTGGTCVVGCHKPKTYSRDSGEESAAAVLSGGMGSKNIP